MTPADDPHRRYAESVDQLRPLIERDRPDITLPAEADATRWGDADMQTFSEAVRAWDRYCQTVRDRVAMFLHVGCELLNADGVAVIPDGFTEALRADDIGELDALMTAIETQRPDLLTLPRWTT